MATRYDLAKRYEVSRQTINEWRGIGAPVNGDVVEDMDDWVLTNRKDRWPFAQTCRWSELLLFAIEDLGERIEPDELRQYAAELAWSVLIRAATKRPDITVSDLLNLIQPPAPIEAEPNPNFEN
ncbi:hypothetical protein ETAA8_28430 [Anatilimnocola aggregata]|uniref:Uncharacterized protein n=1 Tax=Anatilimnocola aggregata TaxID=2528021 RepID=A0A517YBX3_9BACT|nr:hypothetical protein [Anatilimnocola aggregata]QDU27753.1 hypothetical protein ETAA8_28430 [Anatilimnocola aggregata]